MSKQYKVDMNIDVSKATPNGGFILKPPAKDADPKAEPERRTGAEVFVFLASAAINGANPKCGYHELKGFRKVIRLLESGLSNGTLVGNKTDFDVIKHSINGNRGWPNSDEMFDVLEAIVTAIEQAAEITAAK